MANAFVLPADLGLSLDDGMFNLTHDGDVTLEQTFGKEIGTIHAKGDLTLRLPLTTGNLRADGTLMIDGNIEGEVIRGREVHLNGARITARSISATEKIVIGPTRLKVDIIIAPEIVIHPKSTGRVTVIESHNELEPTRVRGGYSLSEYEEDFGDGTAFLEQRGVSRLSGTMPPETGDLPLEETEEAEPLVEDIHELGQYVEPITDSGRGGDSDAAPEETEEDPPSLPSADRVPLDEPPEVVLATLPPDEDPLQLRLTQAMNRIVTCYGDEVPPPVVRLKELVDNRDYDELRGAITSAWTGLLGYHQKEGIRPHHQVTHAFNVIHGIVSEA